MPKEASFEYRINTKLGIDMLRQDGASALHTLTCEAAYMEDSVYLIPTAKSAPSAFMSYIINKKPLGRRYLYIHFIYVIKSERGKGYTKALIEHIKQREGVTTVALAPDEGGLGFWRHLGFEQAGDFIMIHGARPGDGGKFICSAHATLLATMP